LETGCIHNIRGVVGYLRYSEACDFNARLVKPKNTREERDQI
jgi:hypothetical protein